MKFTLKDNQEEAVADELVNMRKASKLLQEEGQKEEKKYLLKLSSQNDQI